MLPELLSQAFRMSDLTVCWQCYCDGTKSLLKRECLIHRSSSLVRVIRHNSGELYK